MSNRKRKKTVRLQNPPLKKVAPVRKLSKAPTEAKIRAHVIAPAHIQNVRIEEVDPAKEVPFKFPSDLKLFQKTHKFTPEIKVPILDVGLFGLVLHLVLKDNVTGYILQVRQHGNPIHIGVWNWAQTPADKNQGWHENTRMHVASVSKYLTAVGMVKLLDRRKVSFDANIIDYLPTYWNKGKNIDQITFRHLLTHQSGFRGGDADYASMKMAVERGVKQIGTGSYSNKNFGLCRILIPIINREINKDMWAQDPQPNPGLIDQQWDVATISLYRDYMRGKVFGPAGAHNADFEPLSSGKKALAYKFPHNNEKGWNSGDLQTVSGSVGWRLSVNELLNVMDHVRRKNTILSPSRSQYILDNFFGIDQMTATPAGNIYNKNGAWGNGPKDEDKKNEVRTEQCVAYFFPNDMEAVVFVNSPIGPSAVSLRNIVRDVFLFSLTS